MTIKKLKILAIAAGVLFLTGCFSADEEANYIKKELDMSAKMKNNIQEAVNTENQKVSEALKQTDVNNINNTNNMENMEYVKKYSGAIIKTNFGDIKVRFYNNDSPITVNNFLKLADEKFYNGTKFHRVIKDFMIQGGCPNSKDDDWADDGTGDPGYRFKDEFNNRKLTRGSLAMANSGPNTNGSQFFIVTAAATPWLDGKHTNFGEVTEGMDVVDKIQKVEKNANDHPTKDVVIKEIELVK